MAYFLTTQRIGFRLWAEDDLQLATALWGDERVTHYIDARHVLTEEQVAQKLQEQLQMQRRHGIQYWPIFLKDTDEHIGCCGLRPKDIEQGVLEFGVHLRRDHWGSGLAAEAGRAAIRYAFGTIGAKRLFAGHHPQNQASRQLLVKLGFTYTGDELYPPTGLLHPSYDLATSSS